MESSFFSHGGNVKCPDVSAFLRNITIRWSRPVKDKVPVSAVATRRLLILSVMRFTYHVSENTWY